MNVDEIMQVMSEGFLNTRELTLDDRCDRCGAAAYIRATKGAQELLFCGHHGKESELGLLDAGWRIQDDTYKLDPNSSVPENV